MMTKFFAWVKFAIFTFVTVTFTFTATITSVFAADEVCLESADRACIFIYADEKLGCEKNIAGSLKNGTAYVSLRELLNLMFEKNEYKVEWISTSKTVKVTVLSDLLCENGENTVVKISANNPYVTVNDEYFSPFINGSDSDMKKIPYIKENIMYVPLRKTAELFKNYVIWNSESNTAHLVSAESVIEENVNDNIDENELYWLSRIISAESRGEPFEGQIAVGNVILERVRSSNFPNSIYEVIFDTEPVIQFTPVENKTVFNEPTKSCIVAALLCLKGYTIDSVKGCVYFQNPKTTRSNWVTENREFAASLGNHSFYK